MSYLGFTVIPPKDNAITPPGANKAHGQESSHQYEKVDGGVVTRFQDALRPKLFKNRYQADTDRLLTLGLHAQQAF